MSIEAQFGEVVVEKNKRDGHPKDTGCSLSKSCLSCPHQDGCKEDPWVKERLQREAQASMDEQMLKLWRSGLPIREVAAKVGVSMKTAQRHLQTAMRNERR